MRRRGIALFLRSLDNDYQQRLREDAAAVARKLGFQLTTVAAQNDAGRQAQQIADALSGPGAGELAAVLVSPVRDDSLEEPARQTARSGAGWVLLNREGAYIESLRDEFDGVPVFGVTPDQLQIGRIQAEQVKGALPKGGPTLCISGPSRTSSSRSRLQGLRDGLGAAYPLIVLEADWTTEGARLVFDAWLADADPLELPAVVCAQNDEMALGARQALRDAASRRDLPRLASTPLTGCDGSPALGERMVREKRLLATVMLPSAAGPAIECLARFRDSGAVPPSLVTLPVSSYPDISKIKPASA